MGSNLSSNSGDDGWIGNKLVPDFLRPKAKRFVPTEEDVYAAQEIFLPKLPLELVNLILDRAEYWPRLLSQKDSDRPYVVQASRPGPLAIASGLPQNNNAYCYFFTPRIPEYCLSTKTKLKVRRVVFHVLSHDQGWEGVNGFIENYEGSHTWFEVGIFRGLGDVGDADPDKIACEIRTGQGDRTERDDGPYQVLNPYNNTRVWHLQSNVRASGVEKMHEIVWDDVRPASNDVPDNFSPSTGSGLGLGFIEQLRTGDSIAVFGCAKYPGWVNYISGVDVQIFYSL